MLIVGCGQQSKEDVKWLRAQMEVNKTESKAEIERLQAQINEMNAKQWEIVKVQNGSYEGTMLFNNTSGVSYVLTKMGTNSYASHVWAKMDFYQSVKSED